MKDKTKIIILVVILVLFASGITIYALKDKLFKDTSTNSTTATEVSDSVESDTKMDEDIDWSKYKTYDVKLSDSYTITKAGVYHFTGSLSNGSITVNTDENVKIILDNVTITNKKGPAINIENADNTYIELTGKNTINATTTEDLDGAIYSSDDLLLLGDGSITITSNYDGIASKDDLVIKSGTYTINATDDGIRGKDSVTIYDGTFTINAEGDGIKSTNEEKGSINIYNGKFNITMGDDGISSISTIQLTDGTYTIKTANSSTSEDSKAIVADSNIQITGGTYNLDTEDDTLHSDANISVTGGTFIINTSDDGMHADGSVIIDNGTITIEKSHEGLEGSYIIINDGNIKINADDDGINVSGGKDSSNNRGDDMFAVSDGYLKITGGSIYVNASGDGLDSNGSMYISGGTTYVDGPTNNGNGALDYNGTCEITGGTLIAVGASGMAQNATSSTQASLLINLSNSYSDSFTIGDITYTPSKSYNSIMISSDKLEVGKTYDVIINGTSVASVEVTDNVTNYGTTSMGGGGMPGGNMNDNGGRGGRR